MTSLQNLMGESIFDYAAQNVGFSTSDGAEKSPNHKDQGEIIPNKNYTHHSVPDDMAEMIPQQSSM